MVVDVVQVMEGETTEVYGFFAKGHHSWEDMLVGIEQRGWGGLLDDRSATISQERVRFIPNPPRLQCYARGRGAFPCTNVQLRKRTVLIILQRRGNFKECGVNYFSWLGEFLAGSLGESIKDMLPLCDIHVSCGLPLEAGDILHSIDFFGPAIILACGEGAQRIARKIGIDFISAPLPDQTSKEQSRNIREEVQRRIRCLSQRTNA